MITCLLFGCQTEYINPEHYELNIGDKVEIYYSTNSCCRGCLIDFDKIEHLRYIEEKTVDSGPRDCDGCAFTFAYVFEAISIGTDSVKIGIASMNQDCDSIHDYISYGVNIQSAE